MNSMEQEKNNEKKVLLELLRTIMNNLGVSPQMTDHVVELGQKGMDKVSRINKMPDVVYIDTL